MAAAKVSILFLGSSPRGEVALSLREEFDELARELDYDRFGLHPRWDVLDGAAKAGGCIATVDADCKASERCKTDGRCTRKGGMCEAVSDADCKASERCEADGRCTAKEGRCQ